MLGNRIAMITHIGRNSGRKRHTVLEVIRSDENKKEYVFYSGWGYNSDWVKNISKTPEIQLSIGGKTLAGKMDQLPISDTKTEVLKYAELHPFIFYLGTKYFLPKIFRNENREQKINLMSKKLPCYIFYGNLP